MSTGDPHPWTGYPGEFGAPTLEQRVRALETQVARLDARLTRYGLIDQPPGPAWSVEFTQCGVCGVSSTDGICPRADCPRGLVIYPPPDHEAS